MTALSCIEEGCGNVQWRLAYCRHHWVTMPLERRVWLEVDKTETCWLWLGLTRGGYGRTKTNYVTVTVHRFVYELLVGPIPDGLVLDHLCGVKNCVRPDHLEPVTQGENASRFAEDRRGIAPRMHLLSWRSAQPCVNGHDLSQPGSTYTVEGRFGGLACAQCAEEQRRRVRKPEGEPRKVQPPRSHCHQGHEFNAENTYLDKGGRRHCKPCANARRRARRAARSAA